VTITETRNDERDPHVCLEPFRCKHYIGDKVVVTVPLSVDGEWFATAVRP
jgi:hypothetical protein